MDDSLEEIKLAARRLATTEADVATFRQMEIKNGAEAPQKSPNPKEMLRT